MISRRSLFSRKLKRYRDMICRKSVAFFTRKPYNSEVGGGRRFEELPDDVIQMILQRLPLSDYLNCRDVSPSWRAAIDSKRWLPAPHHHQFPWLVTSNVYGRDCLASYIRADDNDHDYLRMVISRVIRHRRSNDGDYYCAGSIEGWLIITHNRLLVHRFFFCNPVTGAQVKLPSHPRYGRFFSPIKLVASSVPTTTKCYVTCLHFKYKGRLAFCTSKDKSWTLIEADKALEFRDIEILDGKLYATGRKTFEFLMVFDIHLDTHGSRLHTYTSQRLVALHPNPNVKSIVDYSPFHRNHHLAKFSESKNLYMILYHYPFPPHQNNEFQGLFQVLKLEFDDSTSPRWVEIADLGDRALFMGTNNNKFITTHDETLERNCIYFVLWEKGYFGYNSGVFSLTDRSIRPMTDTDQLRRPVFYHQSTWFTPKPCV